MPSSVPHPSPTLVTNGDNEEYPVVFGSPWLQHAHHTVDIQSSSLYSVAAAAADATDSDSEKKRKRSEVVQHEAIQIETDSGESDTDSVVLINANSSDYKKKQPVVYVKDEEKEIKPNLVPERTLHCEREKVVGEEIDIKFKAFKQFDVVHDHSDHYYARSSVIRTRTWAKNIQKEWKVLEKDLPETIFARAYEDRMDILRAVIIGPDGTPYHDGLFFFDIQFPPNYPHSPPLVHYHSGGLRLNPNLYDNGKVCLSLLNTWSGSGCELWNPSTSTMLQVLVSIQALILNTKPYFNEPGFERLANTTRGEECSIAYNEVTFLNSCRTMLYSLRRPPKHFEDFVAGHFRNNALAILVACKSYMEGAQVGCIDKRGKSCSPHFKSSLKTLFRDLRKEFMSKGVDCEGVCVDEVNDMDMPLVSASQPALPPQLLMPWMSSPPPHLLPFVPMSFAVPSVGWDYHALSGTVSPSTASFASVEISDFPVVMKGFPFTLG